MSGCERCWRDSQRNPYVDSVEEYHRLLAERVGDKACTPEQMAGPEAGECPWCHRRTLHQYTDEPMCGCINKHHAFVIESWRKEALRLRAQVKELEGRSPTTVMRSIEMAPSDADGSPLEVRRDEGVGA